MQETDPSLNQSASEGAPEPERLPGTPETQTGSGLQSAEAQFPVRWRDVSNSVSAKLLILLAATLVLTFGVLGYLNIRLHRHHLEAQTLTAAERMSNVIKRSTSSYMMRNDRNGLYDMMGTMADEPGVVRLRIINPEGRISFSTEPKEVDAYVDKRAEACYGCHAQAQPLARLNRPDRFRIFRDQNGQRILAIITPIENQQACSNASCHAHPESQQILGVLDANLSLAAADANLADSSRKMLIYTAAAVFVIGMLSFLFVWRLVQVRMKLLKRGTEKLRKGELGYQIDIESKDEIGEVAKSFNQMSNELLEAREEITAWTHTLEQRVDQKTRELRRAHEQMLQAERMVTIGKMAAVVAHEINNPLAGILTYAKLIKRWIERGLEGPERKKEVNESLDLIASESRRCGELVKNLLTFSRTSPISLDKADVNAVIQRCVKLVEHRSELTSIQLHVDTDPALPPVYCDAAQIEQVLLALVMNAIDAMPRGGNLWLRSKFLGTEVELTVRDDGMGIPPDVLPKMFEPFTTTKEVGKGVGLGLAISKGIVDRHSGKISVESELGKGTTFRIVLPIDARVSEAAAVAAAGAALVR
jgi:two-component system, NtrC family, sensor kinase